jgi:ubiquitin
MKTSETISESGKKSKVKDSVNSKKVITNSRITEEDIREKAKEIYLQRLGRGEDGTAENDWSEAEKYFNDLEA